MFQKQSLSEAQALQPNEYSKYVKDLSVKWKHMSAEEKEPYIIQAQFEQEARDQLALEPLGLKESGKSELELQVGKKGCSKISGKRLLVNAEHFQSHDLWSSPTQLGDGSMAETNTPGDRADVI